MTEQQYVQTYERAEANRMLDCGKGLGGDSKGHDRGCSVDVRFVVSFPLDF